MNSKERVIATLERQPVDRTPIDCWLYHKYFLDKLEPVYGSREQFMDEFNIDIFTGFMTFPSAGLEGAGNYRGNIGIHDLANIELADPADPKWLNYTNWAEDFAGVNIYDVVKQQGDKRFTIAHLWGIVEGTSMIIGIENCWMQMAENPKLLTAWFDRYADWLCGYVEVLGQTGVDGITLSDDWGSNGTMLFSPRMWRKLIKPYTMRVTKHARAQGLYVNLHSDGYIMQIMDDVVEMGYTSFHPVQESAGMDPATIKRDYADKVAVYGSLDVIDGIYVYDGDELEEYITKRFEIYAPNGGFIFNSGHFIQPDIPPERLIHAYTVVNRLAVKYGNRPAVNDGAS
jgi:uroporphyrinogen decarboxylase